VGVVDITRARGGRGRNPHCFNGNKKLKYYNLVYFATCMLLMFETMFLYSLNYNIINIFCFAEKYIFPQYLSLHRES
jgi:hypothetical protein